MSKIGKKPIALPSGVTCTVQDNLIVVKGAKGELKEVLPAGVTVVVAENEVVVLETTGTNQGKANHGLVRSLIANMVVGVSTGYTRRLEMIGTGYRVAQKGKNLSLTVGFSHPVEVTPLDGITLSVEGNNIIIVSGASKHMVGQMAANIRDIKPPEPYKGKGIRYEGEYVRRKQGKTGVK